MDVVTIKTRLAGWLARPKPDTNIAGQVALITGGSRGLGWLIARELGQAGCKLVLTARDEAELNRAKQALGKLGYEVMTLVCDVADRIAVEKMVVHATALFGRIDILVNDAGIIQVGPAQQMTIEDFESIMAVDFWGTVYTTLAVLPQMRQRQSGRIVNITSIAGKVSIPHLLPYSAAKFAATGFSQGLRAELRREGISVTTILPGVLRNGSAFNAFFKGDPEKEYGWFGLTSSLPLLSMQAERAAAQIVEAIKIRKPEKILSLQAVLLARFNGLLPDTAARVFALANRLGLPADQNQSSPLKRGMELQKSPLLKTVTGLGEAAARRFGQFPGPSKEIVDKTKAGPAAKV